MAERRSPSGRWLLLLRETVSLADEKGSASSSGAPVALGLGSEDSERLSASAPRNPPSLWTSDT